MTDTKQGVLDRLKRLGPLPDYAGLTQARLDEFHAIIDNILDWLPPDPDYIRPLLATFGYTDGVAYWRYGADALVKQDRAAVVAACLDVIEAGPDGPRLWAVLTLQRIQEYGRGERPPPTERELLLIESVLHGPRLVAEAAVYYAYWLDGPDGRRLLRKATEVCPPDLAAEAADQLRKLG